MKNGTPPSQVFTFNGVKIHRSRFSRHIDWGKEQYEMMKKEKQQQRKLEAETNEKKLAQRDNSITELSRFAIGGNVA